MIEAEVATAMVEVAKTFIMEELLILIPVLYFIGFLLKRTKNVQNWMIPWIVMGLGIVFSLLLVAPTPEAIIQGILIAGATVLTHELYSQTVNRDV